MVGAGTVSDTYFNRVTLLLNTSSTNGAQNNTFLDSSSNGFTITRNGNTTQGTFTPFSQTGWSNYFGGGGNNYLSVPNNAALNLSTGDFTLEAFIYVTSFAANSAILDKRVTQGSAAPFVWYTDTAGKLNFYNGTNYITTSTFSLNTWVHVVTSRVSGTLYQFINGVSAMTPTAFTANLDTTSTLYIGSSNDVSPANFAGYISNLRIVKGSGVTSVTVPTSPLTAISGTSLLTCQSNRFLDNSSNAFTVTGNNAASVQAFSPFAPTAAYSTSVVGGSGYFDGTGDYLTLADNVAFEPGTGDFAITGWVYHTTASGSLNVYFAHTTNGLSFYRNSSGKLEIAQDGVAALATSTNNVPVNAWSYVEASRSGTSLKLFINGSQEASVTNSTNFAGTGSVGIGATAAGGSTFTGYFSGWRLIKGSAGNTAAYTPPTAPPTAITNTSLLLNYTNAGIYDAAAKNDMETVGNAQVSTTQAKFGTTSMYFDGTGDYLQLPAAPNLALFTGDFTVEMWVYPTSYSAATNYPLWDTRGSATSTNGYYFGLSQTNGYPIVYLYPSIILTGSSGPALNTWSHVAFCRASGTIRAFVNGTQVGSVANSNSITDPSVYISRIGQSAVGGVENFTGYIDEFRVSRYARYTSNFTAPSAAFPVQ